MATRYVAPNGLATNDGTIGSPWTLAFACSGAAGAIHPGDTVLLRGGAYNLIAGFTITVSGSAGLPIEFAAYPGESPVIDGCYQEFVNSPSTAWEPYDLVGHNVYRSTGTYISGSTHDGCGFMQMDGKLRTLLPHPNGLSYITSNVQDFVYPSAPRYMGYGFAWNPVSVGGDNKIYIRLDTPDAGSMLATSAGDGTGLHNNYPILADPDPRHYPISLFPCDNVGIKVTGAFVTFGAGILVRNYQQTLAIQGANCTIRGCELQYGYQGLRMQAIPGLTLDGVYFNAAMPSETSWFAWTDVKGGETPAQRIRKNAILFNSTFNAEIKNCTFRECFDGILADGTTHDINCHDNLFDNVWDDSWQIYGSLYRIEFARNKCFGAGVSHDDSGSATPNTDPGTVWIHHNIFDPTKYLVFWGRRGRDNAGQGNTGDEGLKRSDALGTHGLPTVYSMPWKLYYNTIVMDKWSRDGYVDIAEFGRTATHHQAPHEVFNNIIVTRKQLGNHFDSATGNQIYDGNVYYYPVFLNLHWRFITTSTGVIPPGASEPNGLLDTIAQMHATQAFPDSKVYYAPGWEASGLDMDPQLDGNYSPQAAAVRTGAVDLTAKPWPGVTPYQACRGAIGLIQITELIFLAV